MTLQIIKYQFIIYQRNSWFYRSYVLIFAYMNNFYGLTFIGIRRSIDIKYIDDKLVFEYHRSYIMLHDPLFKTKKNNNPKVNPNEGVFVIILLMKHICYPVLFVFHTHISLDTTRNQKPNKSIHCTFCCINNII